MWLYGRIGIIIFWQTLIKVEGTTKWNTADRSDGACRGVRMSVRGAHVCQRSDMKWDRQTDLTGHAEGHVWLSEKQRSKKRETDWTGHAEGCACLSAEWRSEIRQTNLTGHAVRRARLSEEQHAENGAHHLNLLLLNHFSSNFVFVITYHTARQIIERSCHLLSHAVHNSKLTKLPQSKRRWQPSWQRILEARQIFERLAKDLVTVTLFHNMTWFILGHA